MEEDKTKTPKAVSKKTALDSLKGIKLKVAIPRTDKDVALPIYIDVLTKGGGFSTGFTKRTFDKRDLEANPVLMIKKEPKLAAWTNATKEQVDLIAKTSITKLEKI